MTGSMFCVEFGMLGRGKGCGNMGFVSENEGAGFFIVKSEAFVGLNVGVHLLRGRGVRRGVRRA